MRRTMKKLIGVSVCLLSINSALAASYDEVVNQHQLLMLKQAEQQAADIQAMYNIRGGNFATVGSDNACDFRVGATKIQDAIDDLANYDEIRIASNDTYEENLTISNRTITLRGGFSDCTDAQLLNNQNSNDRTTISGDSNNNFAVLTITGDTQRNTVVLENLTFRGGSGSFFSTGGITTFAADLFLDLRRVSINNNSSGSFGGGLNVVNGDTDVVGTDITIGANTGFDGGGVYCDGSNNSVLIDGVSQILNNKASSNDADFGNGGGFHVTNGCFLSMYSGQNSNSTFDLSGVLLNDATGNGGGVYVDNGGKVNFIGAQTCFTILNISFCRGNNDTVANISGNEAEKNGGGVYVEGENSSFLIDSGLILNNTAVLDGGGIYVGDKADFVMTWDEQVNSTSQGGNDCWSPGKCSQISGNKGRWGGAIAVYGDAEAKIYRTEITKSRADLGVVGYVRDNGSALTFNGNVIVDNGKDGDGNTYDDFSLFRPIENGLSFPALIITNSTVADNAVTENVFAINETSINVSATIINEPGTTLYSQSGANNSGFFDCVLVDDNSTVPAGSSGVVVDDPEFVDRANGDYHINAALSPAVDLCAGFSSTSRRDMDLEERGYDDPDVGNVTGPFDAGADETYSNDIIFKHNFDQ